MPHCRAWGAPHCSQPSFLGCSAAGVTALEAVVPRSPLRTRPWRKHLVLYQWCRIWHLANTRGCSRKQLAFSKLVYEEITAYNIRETDSSVPCPSFLCGAGTKPKFTFYVTFLQQKRAKVTSVSPAAQDTAQQSGQLLCPPGQRVWEERTALANEHPWQSASYRHPHNRSPEAAPPTTPPSINNEKTKAQQSGLAADNPVPCVLGSKADSGHKAETLVLALGEDNVCQERMS